MAHVFHSGDKAFIVDNARFLREVTVLRITRDLCIIRYVDTGTIIRIKKSRLFETEEKAVDHLPPDARPHKRNHWDYELYR